jgi:tetratricopeptide (TPR) repeat protein
LSPASAARSLLLVWALVGSAAARPPRSEADEHRDRGARLYESKRYEEALLEFRASYELSPDPRLLYTLGQASRLAGHCKEAIQLYRAFLRSEPSAFDRDATRVNIDRCLGRPHASAAPSPSLHPAPSPPASPDGAAEKKASQSPGNSRVSAQPSPRPRP